MGQRGKKGALQVLDNCLFPEIKEWFPENDGIFMQDGPP
jgi:hypothetical protein